MTSLSSIATRRLVLDAIPYVVLRKRGFTFQTSTFLPYGFRRRIWRAIGYPWSAEAETRATICSTPTTLRQGLTHHCPPSTLISRYFTLLRYYAHFWHQPFQIAVHPRPGHYVGPQGVEPWTTLYYGFRNFQVPLTSWYVVSFDTLAAPCASGRF